ncbi:MAG: hypothetical protein KF712_19730 [Akkermansiaceae bacterium]|nr:hypothetical protein [Akkermansiaceae bacterium]
MGKEAATNNLVHERLIFGYAREYLENCRRCTLDDCNPAIRGCGLKVRNNGIIRSVKPRSPIFAISDETDLPTNALVLVERTNPCAVWEVDAKHIVNLYHDGGIPAVSPGKESGLRESGYQGLVEGARILPGNLRQSYSGLVLAGRAAGESETRRIYDTTYFSDGDETYTVAELLSIKGWSDATISRTAFHNIRNDRLDHQGAKAELVVADGDASFLNALDSFRESDVIGVIDRTSDRDRLEAIGLKLTALRERYQPDTQSSGLPPLAVPGISTFILQKQ